MGIISYYWHSTEVIVGLESLPFRLQGCVLLKTYNQYCAVRYLLWNNGGDDDDEDMVDDRRSIVNGLDDG